MGERKVLNKYYPPDFDPAKLPRNRRAPTNEMKVRMMLPMSIRCNTCGTFMYKGTKFNTRKEDVVGEDYLGLQIFRFYFHCTNCAAEFALKTDPKNQDYLVEAGASRNYEPWRETDKAKVENKKQREEEEAGNAMKALENRTLDSKREMDVLSALDELKGLNSRHSKVSTEQVLQALLDHREVQGHEEELPDEDMAALQGFFQQQAAAGKAISDDDVEETTALRKQPDLVSVNSNARPGDSVPRPVKPAVRKPAVIVKRKQPGPSASLDAKRQRPVETTSGTGDGALLGLGAYGSDDST